MKTCVLASGSKGNVSFVSTASTRILIDLGPSCLYTEKKLKEIGEDPDKIDAILISHTHSDHINGLKVFLKKHPILVYLSQKMYEDLKQMMDITNYQIIEDDFMIGDIYVSIIKTSHDASDSNGYILESNHKSVVYITDTGYIHIKNHQKLQNKSIYIMESNHDVKKLMEGSYPYHIKQRILGDRGHLSNKDSSYYLSKFVGKDTNTVILAHLSHENNDPSLALDALNESIPNHEFEVIIATQDERTELIEV